MRKSNKRICIIALCLTSLLVSTGTPISNSDAKSLKEPTFEGSIDNLEVVLDKYEEYAKQKDKDNATGGNHTADGK